jgi:hypothetical protein
VIPRAQSISRAYRPYTGEVGCYASVTPDVDSQMKLVDWAQRLGFWLDPMQEAKLHCTVVYSKSGAPLSYNIDPKVSYSARLRGFEFWEGHDSAGYLVATLGSPALTARHNYWVAAGADHSFSDYLPHVTLLKDIRATDALYQRMMRLSHRERGSILTFYDEQVEDIKP